VSDQRRPGLALVAAGLILPGVLIRLMGVHRDDWLAAQLPIGVGWSLVVFLTAMVRPDAVLVSDDAG